MTTELSRHVTCHSIDIDARRDSQPWHPVHERHTSPGEEPVLRTAIEHMPDRWPTGNGPGSRLLLLISRGAACMFLLCMAKCVT
ncbi:hypothetical protein GGI42DRAFT_106804 [Trichoderma sp. SZMC 28013]